MFNKYAKNSSKYLYFVFRVLFGVLFFFHGAQKLFGWFSTTGPAPLGSIFGIAGIIELVAGIFIACGLYTRIVALIAGIEMLVAYFKAHAPSGIVPLVNHGELALLYFAGFLILFAYGAGIWRIESLWTSKEI